MKFPKTAQSITFALWYKYDEATHDENLYALMKLWDQSPAILSIKGGASSHHRPWFLVEVDLDMAGGDLPYIESELIGDMRSCGLEFDKEKYDAEV